MSFKEELALHTAQAEDILKKYLPAEEGLQKTVLEAMNYSALAGGKRLRPILMQETFRLFGGEGEIIEPFMAAIEMIHTSSLVHDDLPAMDGDEYRRGKKTTWVQYGEDMAILAGDGLMIFAFEAASEAFAILKRDGLGGDMAERIGECIRILANRTGIYGMIGGQTVDVEMTGKSLDENQLYYIYAEKTGALLQASMTIGAVLAGASEEDVKTVGEAAKKIGLAFQIQDDILDLTSTTEELGKPVGSDEKNEKTTYVTLHGLTASAAKVKEISEEAISALQELPGENPFLMELVRSLITRRK